MQPRTGAADDHHVGLPAFDDAHAFGNRQQARRFGQHDRVVRAAASCAIATWQAGMLGRYLSIHSGYISPIACWPHWLKSNPSPSHARAKGLDQFVGLDLDHVGAEHDPKSVGREGRGVERGVLDGELSRREGQLISRDMTFRLLRGVTYFLASKSSTVPPTRMGNSGVSKRPSRRTPLWPVVSAARPPRPIPMGLAAPIPVTTICASGEIIGGGALGLAAFGKVSSGPRRFVRARALVCRIAAASRPGRLGDARDRVA